MALVDAIMPYLQEEERKRKEAEMMRPGATVEPAPAAEPLPALSEMTGVAAAPAATEAPVSLPVIPPSRPTLTTPAYPPPTWMPGSGKPKPQILPEVEESKVALSLAGINPAAKGDPVLANVEKPGMAHSMYMTGSREMQHGIDPEKHKGFGNRFKHALQGAGIGALTSIGDAWKNSGGRGSFQDLLGAGIGGAGAGGGLSAYNPKYADKLYDKLLLQPEIDREVEKDRINQAEAIKLKAGELGLDKLRADIASSQAELADMPEARQRLRDQNDLAKRRADLEERKFKYEQEGMDVTIDPERGIMYDRRTGKVLETFEPKRLTGRGSSTDLGYGSEGLNRYAKQVEDTLRSKFNTESIAQRSMEGDKGGLLRHLIAVSGGDPANKQDVERAEQMLNKWKTEYQNPDVTTMPSKQAENVMKAIAEAQKRFHDEKFQGAEDDLKRRVQAEIDRIQGGAGSASGGGGGGGGRTRPRKNVKGLGEPGMRPSEYEGRPL
jgi:hypothetical protein